MWTRRGTYLHHANGRVRISRWDISSGRRYHVQEKVNGQWVERAKPAPLSAEEAKKVAEDL